MKNFTVRLFFLWLPSSTLAKTRVAERVNTGGHSIPPVVIERRYERGLKNLSIFRANCDSWIVADNSGNTPNKIAEQTEKEIIIYKSDLWKKIVEHGL